MPLSNRRRYRVFRKNCVFHNSLQHVPRLTSNASVQSLIWVGNFFVQTIEVECWGRGGKLSRKKHMRACGGGGEKIQSQILWLGFFRLCKSNVNNNKKLHRCLYNNDGIWLIMLCKKLQCIISNKTANVNSFFANINNSLGGQLNFSLKLRHYFIYLPLVTHFRHN